jgi:hypothetical protein
MEGQVLSYQAWLAGSECGVSSPGIGTSWSSFPPSVPGQLGEAPWESTSSGGISLQLLV